MKLAVVGIGKLGMPFALALDQAGFKVQGFDTSPFVKEHFDNRTWPHREAHVPELLETHKIKWAEPPFDVDVAFIAVPTPHHPKFDGTRLLDDERADFDYTYLQQALQVTQAPIVAVISTVLPGTWKTRFQHVPNYVYTPQFIAMGTVVTDLKRAEFNLIGTEATRIDPLETIWRTLNDAPIMQTGITEAEAIKVAYNTFISAKVSLANTWGWLAEQIGFSADAVTEAWRLADRRLLSGRYLSAGMGDNGPCHPRDNIALSWLAREHGVYDIFGDLARQREAHTEWLASMLPDGVVIFGRAFKPDIQIEAGSSSLLLADILTRQGKSFTLAEDPEPGRWNFLATAHSRYRDISWPQGSTVIDPHGIIPEKEGVKVLRLGR